jgi:hypothetical protein
MVLLDWPITAGKPSGLTLARFAGPTVPLEQVDAETLRKLVGGER